MREAVSETRGKVERESLSLGMRQGERRMEKKTEEIRKSRKGSTRKNFRARRLHGFLDNKRHGCSTRQKMRSNCERGCKDDKALSREGPDQPQPHNEEDE